MTVPASVQTFRGLDAFERVGGLVRRGDMGGVQAALAAGFEPDRVPNPSRWQGWSMLAEALACHQPAIARVLLPASDARKQFYRDGAWDSYLHLAAGEGMADLIQPLVDAGLDPNMENRLGWRPLFALHPEKNNQDPDASRTLQALINAGADPKKRANGWGFGGYAVRHFSAEMVGALLDHPAVHWSNGDLGEMMTEYGYNPTFCQPGVGDVLVAERARRDGGHLDRSLPAGRPASPGGRL